MILAEKIMNLRKKNGWSQEELAEQLNISRQSVSKWESGASIPDLERIIAMSNLFGVSTDYLIKEEQEQEDPTVSLDVYMAPDCRNVSVEEANAFMNLCKQTAGKIAAGVAVCIISPVILILLAGLSEYGVLRLSEDAASGIGVSILLVMIAGAVAIFILNGMKLDKYEYMEKERLALQYGVQGIVEKKKEEYADKYRTGIVLGVTLCILAVVPLFVGVAFEANDLVMIYCTIGILCLVAAGVYSMVRVCGVQESFEKLLQEGDYTIEKKSMSKKTSFFTVAYWCVAVAVFLILSNANTDFSWKYVGMYWPVVALIFVALKVVLKAVLNAKSRDE